MTTVNSRKARHQVERAIQANIDERVTTLLAAHGEVTVEFGEATVEFRAAIQRAYR
jgi:hypothetical protein